MFQLEISPTPEDGLYRLDLQYARPPTSGSASRLFQHFLQITGLRPSRIEVDLRLAEYQDIELFGTFDVSPLPHRDTQVLNAKRHGVPPFGAVLTKLAPDLNAVLDEVVEDVGWFTMGAFGIALDNRVLVDQMKDGIFLRAWSTRPWTIHPTS